MTLTGFHFNKIKLFGDITAGVLVSSSWLGVFTPIVQAISTLFALVYLCIRIWETKTVQELWSKYKSK